MLSHVLSRDAMVSLVRCNFAADALGLIDEQELSLKRDLRAQDGRSDSWVDGVSGHFCSALREPLLVLASALLLGRGGVLHTGGVGFLSNRFAYPGKHADQRAPASAQHLPCPVVEVLRLSS